MIENIDENKINLPEKLINLPTKPGVYQFLNQTGKVIYVGKAINLRNRVKSYFQSRPQDAKTTALVKHIADVEVIVTDSEAEALILEDTLIKKLKPRYNILLRDDKSYPYVRITNEPYPRIFPTRKVIRDGSKYLGPFTEVRNLRALMRILRTLFRIRSCDLNITEETISKKKHKICLDYHIQKCDGPCEGLISQEKYNENIKNAVQIINGKTDELEKFFEKQMLSLAEEMRFEEAAIVRNRLQLLRDYTNQQKVVSSELIDRDIIGLSRQDELACSLVFKVRDGKLIGKRHYILQNSADFSDGKLIQITMEKWYLENEFIPKEILLPTEPEQTEFVYDWLRKKRGKSIEIVVPKLGDKKKLVNMASANAEFQLKEYLIAITKREQSVTRAVLSLQRDLRLSKPPLRIECFDNSHIQGSELVSSMVVFENGKAKKSDYRKFIIRDVHKNDDFAAMREAVGRRYKRVLEENEALPDLIVIDGGKGQLSSALEVLKELKIEKKVNIIGLAKRLEEVFLPNSSEPIQLPRTSSSLKLLQQVRDEAHRFAITFHRKLREKRTLHTELTDIKGIGKTTAQKLLIEFGSVEKIKSASQEELKKFLTEKQLSNLLEHFKQ
ncbi:MAG: excinuclease ABC subunit UvrC [Candidatus Kapabacteria bacterium]|nr:excinuclease ABC subunit UvrC [Candidatus Kapabacteria bacterium]